jgi:hypothetical protein
MLPLLPSAFMACSGITFYFFRCLLKSRRKFGALVLGCVQSAMYLPHLSLLSLRGAGSYPSILCHSTAFRHICRLHLRRLCYDLTHPSEEDNKTSRPITIYLGVMGWILLWRVISNPALHLGAPSSILVFGDGCPKRFLCGFSQLTGVNFGVVFYNRPLPLHCTSFPTNYSKFSFNSSFFMKFS